jgi:hypothetical protein
LGNASLVFGRSSFGDSTIRPWTNDRRP